MFGKVGALIRGVILPHHFVAIPQARTTRLAHFRHHGVELASIPSWSRYGLARSARILSEQAPVQTGVAVGRLSFLFVWMAVVVRFSGGCVVSVTEGELQQAQSLPSCHLKNACCVTSLLLPSLRTTVVATLHVSLVGLVMQRSKWKNKLLVLPIYVRIGQLVVCGALNQVARSPSGSFCSDTFVGSRR